MSEITPPKLPEKPIPSPCVSICSLDDNDICIGCQRSGDEIINWGKMDNQQRLEVLRKAAQRN